VVLDGARCERPSAIRIGDGSWDGYTFTCRAHAELVLASELGCLAEPVSGVPDGRAGDETDVPRAAPEIAAALIAEIRNALVPASRRSTTSCGSPPTQPVRPLVSSSCAVRCCGCSTVRPDVQSG
jgi:hypothetical protein